MQSNLPVSTSISVARCLKPSRLILLLLFFVEGFSMANLACAEVRPICRAAYVRNNVVPTGIYSKFDLGNNTCHAKAYSGSYFMLSGEAGCVATLGVAQDIPEFCGTKCLPGDTSSECTDNKNKGKCGEGNPCDPITGNKFQTEADYRSAGGYLDIVRYYNSLSPKDIGVGFGWSSTLLPRLIRDNTTATPFLAVVKANGSREVWMKVSGVWQKEGDSQLQLVESSTAFTLTWPDARVEEYDLTGKLKKITDKNGLVTSYNYNASGQLLEVNGPYSRKLTVVYTAGRISKITTPDGDILYTYNAAGNLTHVTYPDTKVRQYLYGEANFVSATPDSGVIYTYALTGIIDENNKRFATWSYDASGKAASSEHAGGVEKISMTYSNGDTQVTGALGDVRTYSSGYYQNTAKAKAIAGDACSNCSAANLKSRTYDINGNMLSNTDLNGNTTCYAYNARNLETHRIEGLAPGISCPTDVASYIPSTTVGSVERKVTTQWHATWRAPEIVAEPLRITTYGYDTKGNLSSRSEQATTDATGANGIVAVNSTKRTTSYTYTAGKIATIDGPRDNTTDVLDKTTYSYDTITGNLLSITNALSHVTSFSNYDGSGRAKTITDPNGLITNMVYDPRGRLTSSTTGSEQTNYTYKASGELETVTLPAGAAYTYTYDDAHRLTKITDKDGNSITYTLDSMGNRTKEEVKNSVGTVVKTHSRQFDKLNRLWKDIGTINNDIIIYEYDANGNLKTVIDQLTRKTENKYDALNRLVSTTDPLLSTETSSGITQYAYNQRDQLVQVTDPRNLMTKYTINGLGDLTSVISPDAGTTISTVDAAGNVITKTDEWVKLPTEIKRIANYKYDALNRVTQLAYSKSTSPTAYEYTISYEYDQGPNAKGKVSKVSDNVSSTSYSYNSMGRLISVVRQLYPDPANKAIYASYTTSYDYDTVGRLNKMTYPSGRSIDYAFDSMGRINKISSTYNSQTVVLASSISYFPFGGVSGFTHGDGVSTPIQKYTRTFDSDGRLKSYTLKGSVQTIGYDIASQITSITSASAPTDPASYSYDALGHLTRYSTSSTSQDFTYDKVGNRLSQNIAGIQSTLKPAATSNRLESIQTGATIKTMVFDPAGAMTSDPSKANTYVYDLRERMTSATSAAGISTYSIDAQGLRIRKKTPTADTWYHYDTQGQLIAENSVGTTMFKEYVYLGELPIAVIQP